MRHQRTSQGSDRNWQDIGVDPSARTPVASTTGRAAPWTSAPSKPWVSVAPVGVPEHAGASIAVSRTRLTSDVVAIPKDSDIGVAEDENSGEEPPVRTGLQAIGQS